MTRANDYLELVEGFKLGKLGAGKKTFHVEPQTIQDDEQQLNIWDVQEDTRNERITWSQHWDQHLLKALRVDEVERDISHIQIILSAIPDENSWIPTLRFRQKGTSFGGIDDRFFTAKRLAFDTQEDFVTWLLKYKPKIKKVGIEAIQDFPKNWKWVSP
jgi:hypothetical protein